GMGNEKVRVGAVEHDHANVRIGFHLATQAVDLLHQGYVEQIDRRVVDRGEAHSAIEPNLEALVVLISHFAVPLSGRRLAAVSPCARRIAGARGPSDVASGGCRRNACCRVATLRISPAVVRALAKITVCSAENAGILRGTGRAVSPEDETRRFSR